MTEIKTYNSNRIGGNVVVIETTKSKIAIDFGENLPGCESENIEIEGLSKGKISFDGVFFTHYHGDHIGRMQHILPDVPLYMGEIARKVLININLYTKQNKTVEFLKNEERIFELHENVPVSINNGDIVVTPYSVDHSAYEAFMFLIETKDKNGNPDKVILHTGDFRCHGYRGKALLPVINSYIRKHGKCDVDILIIEGTMFSRTTEDVFTEQELQNKAKEFFKDHRHIFLLCSSTNLDSLASFYQAGQKYNMNMFGNRYIATQLRTFSEIAGQKSSLYKFDKLWEIDFDKQLEKGSFKGTQEDYMRKYGFVCLVKENEKYEKWIERFKDCNPIVIYSMWDGYLDSKKSAYNEKLDKFCKKYNAIHMHTSGHATAGTIAEVIKAVNPKEAIYPIHSEKPEMMYNIDISEDLKKKVVMNGQNITIENIAKYVKDNCENISYNSDYTKIYYKGKSHIFCYLSKKNNEITVKISANYSNKSDSTKIRKELAEVYCFKGSDGASHLKKNFKGNDLSIYNFMLNFYEYWKVVMDIHIGIPKSKEDKRAVSYANEFCKGGKLEKITKFVKNPENNLTLLFRGNSGNKAIVYYNNKKFWELEKCGSKFKISISVNHAKDENDKSALDNAKKILSAAPYSLKENWVLMTGEYKEEFLDQLYKEWQPVMEKYFRKNENPKSAEDYKHLEKIRQHQIFLDSNYKNTENGCFIYDLEYTMPYEDETQRTKDKGNVNQADFLAIKFENSKPKALVLGEVKSTVAACNGKSSGVYNHIKKMGRMLDADRQTEIDNRKTDVVQIMKDYKSIGLYNCEVFSNDLENISVEFLFVFTDKSINWLNKRIKEAEKSRKNIEDELFLQILKNKLKNGNVTSECKIKSKYEEEFVKCVELKISKEEYLKAKNEIEGKKNARYLGI